MTFHSNNESKKIFIYLIFCKDQSITDTYIGQTDNFERRLSEHEKTCSSKDNKKLYSFIRENGGWVNWNMKILNTYICNNDNETKQIEQKYIEYYKSSLNSISSYSTYKNVELDKFLETQLNNIEKKEIPLNFTDNLEIKEKSLLIESMSEICEYCNKRFNTKYSLNKHKKTAKYCFNQRKNNNIECNDICTFDCTFCLKSFTSNENLQNHLLVCLQKLKTLLNEKDEELRKKDEIIQEMNIKVIELSLKTKLYEEHQKSLIEIAIQSKT